MKNYRLITGIGLLLMMRFAVGASELLDIAKNLHPAEVGQPFLTALEEKTEKRAQLTKELGQLREAKKEVLPALSKHIDLIKHEIEVSKRQLQERMEDEFFTKKLALANETRQVLLDHQKFHELLEANITEQIELLDGYLNDPTLEQYKKDVLTMRDAPRFEDLQDLYQRRAEKELAIEQLEEQEKNIVIELENRKRTADATIKEYKKKLEERQIPDSVRMSIAPFWLDPQKKATLIQLEDRLYAYKKELNALRLREIESKRSLVKTKLFIERLHLETLKELIRAIKPAIRINEADVAFARDELIKMQQHFFDTKELYRQHSESVSKELKEKDALLQMLVAHNHAAYGPDLYEWRFDMPRTAPALVALFEVAALGSETQLLQRKKDFLEAQALVEETKMHDEEVRVDVMSSFYKVIARKFRSDEEVAREKHGYDIERARLEEELSSTRQKQAVAQAHLATQKKALDTLERKQKELAAQRGMIFKPVSSDEMQVKAADEQYAKARALLQAGQGAVQAQYDYLAKMQGLYADIITNIEKTRKQVGVIIFELDSITTVWHRPEESISWEGINNIPVDLKMLFSDLSLYLSDLPVTTWFDVLVHHMPHYTMLILFVLLAIAALFLLIGLRRAAAPASAWLLRRASQTARVASQVLYSGCALIISFVARHALLIACWLFFCVSMVRLYALVDPYFVVLFYLVSIPFWIFLARRFINFCALFNVMQGYTLWSAGYQQRLMVIMAVIFYPTIVLYFLKKSFILMHYPKSEFPIILAALYWIIVQTALIFVPTKEWILDKIYGEHPFWVWLHLFIDTYYSFLMAFLVAIIIMINPYIGFGGLVFYIFVRLLWTAILVPILFWIHHIIKQAASHLFFHIEKTVVRERFAYAKTSYSLFVISIFLFFAFIGLIFLAHVWGWPSQFVQIKHLADVQEWLSTPFLLQKTDSPISVITLLKLVVFIIAGFLVSFVAEHFVLGKIFDVMLVEAGVQNAVSSIMRYVIVLAAIILGFYAAGLGGFVYVVLVALTVSIGWIIKEPVGDFVAYFIILVQRPVKIGDYIKMDDEITGVVRRITPRAVVVRRKNSTTLIVPNSLVISKPLANWNYIRGFVAFEDIVIRVQYASDPLKVKGLLEKVLEEHPLVLKSPKPVIRLENFSENGFEFMVRGFVSSNYTLDLFDIASDVRLGIVSSFRQHDIRLAVPIYMVLDQEGKQMYDNPML